MKAIHQPDPLYAVARWISIGWHPFVSATLLVTMRSVHAQGGLPGLQSACMALALIIVPCGLFVLWKTHTGAWQDIDVSDRRQRPVLYALGLASTLLLLLATRWISRFAHLWPIIVATLALLALNLLLNQHVKVSMHAACCAFAGISTLAVSIPCGSALLAAGPFVCWARVRMRRHSFVEVCIGTAVGLGVGLASLSV